MTAFDFAPLFARDLPPAAKRWTAFAEHNFVGGHNDPEGIPVEALIDSAVRQLRAKGSLMAIYTLDGGPQGLRELREVVARKLTRDRGAPTDPEERQAWRDAVAFYAKDLSRRETTFDQSLIYVTNTLRRAAEEP